MRTLTSVATLALSLGLPVFPAQAQAGLPKYRVEVLKGPADMDPKFIAGLAFNDLGHVTGYARFGDPLQDRYGSAFIYKDGKLDALGPFGGEPSRGLGINNRGEIAGYYVSRGAGSAVPVLYRDGRIIDLGASLRPGDVGEAVAINQAGQVVGNMGASGLSFMYENGRSRYLPRDAGTRFYQVSGLNDRGDVIGQVWNDCCTYQGFVLRDGELRRLPSFGGDYSFANAINDQGLVVGSAWTRDMNGYLPVLYQNDELRSLGTLGGRTGSANDVNEAGWIVGQADRADGRGAGFLWRDGAMHDLNGLLAGDYGKNRHISGAVAINEAGQILAYSQYNGLYHSARTVILTPVPEASSVAMTLAGLGVLGWVARRRRPTA
ncbi:PEP-CTERM sorting domain-containing protein [Azohydromonas caseinilytica]|uniref:DUF3466 family protein n=1 Tax=Azohydromonas caseinilytica TaxID=2728836 RepID=A0A848FHK6_9BURK|nr:PEP-CTERM sorting domain-containing protein [Azohydromonas caseinilytica]NML18742.1 DUF3466 family protein [Azohydromonas caseinilytica]